MFICDFPCTELYGVLSVRSKGKGMSENNYGFVCILSQRLMFGLKCFFIYIISVLYHLSVSDLRFF